MAVAREMEEKFAQIWQAEAGKQKTANQDVDKTCLEAVWLTKLKIFTVWTFTEKVCQPLGYMSGLEYKIFKASFYQKMHIRIQYIISVKDAWLIQPSMDEKCKKILRTRILALKRFPRLAGVLAHFSHNYYEKLWLPGLPSTSYLLSTACFIIC